MPSADPEDIVTAASDDVTVEKSFEPDDFPVPAIAFTIRSERDTAVSVRLADTVPDDVAPENIGFHPKYGAEFWDVEDGRIVFRRDLAPGEKYTTVYGLRGGDADTAAKFMSEPTLESIDPPLSEDDGAVDADQDGETSASVDEDTDEPEVLDLDDQIDTGDQLDEIGSTGGDFPAEELDIEERIKRSKDGSNGDEPGDGDLDLAEGQEEPSKSGGESSDGSSGQSEDETALPSEDDSLVSELAAEIRGGNVDDDDIVALRDALGLDLASASVEARIEHLQSEVSDLEAYTDALEAFLDEEGDAQTLIAEARDGHDEIADRLDELEAQFADTRSDLDERVEAIDERIEETIDERIEETIDERIDSEIDEIRSDLDTVEGRLETETDARAEVESEIQSLSTELAEVAEMRDRLTNALGGLGGRPPSDDTDAAGNDANDDENDGDGSDVTDGTDDTDDDADTSDSDTE